MHRVYMWRHNERYTEKWETWYQFSVPAPLSAANTGVKPKSASAAWRSGQTPAPWL